MDLALGECALGECAPYRAEGTDYRNLDYPGASSPLVDSSAGVFFRLAEAIDNWLANRFAQLLRRDELLDLTASHTAGDFEIRSTAFGVHHLHYSIMHLPYDALPYGVLPYDALQSVALRCLTVDCPMLPYS